MLAGSLEIQLLANMAQLTKDMDMVRSQVGGAMSHVERAASVAKGALIGLGAVGLAAAFVGNLRAAIDLADGLNKLTQRTGLSVESLSQLQYAAKMADVSNESLSTGLKKLNINIAAGAAGDKEKVAMFKALGITVTDTAGRVKTADVVLMEIADTFAKSKDGAGKTAAAVAALGKAGDEMIPLLNGGSESIKAMMAEADKLGLTIGTDFAAQAEEFNDNLTRVQASSQKLTIALAGDLVSGLGKAMKAMADATIEGGKLAGVIAGIQMLLTGDDLHKANVATVKGTELVMAAEAALDKARASGDAKRIERLTAAVALRKQELATDLNYRKMLEADQAKDEAAAAALKKLRTEGAEIKLPGGAAAAAQMSEFDKLAKKIQEQIDLDTASLALGRELTESEKFRSKVISEMVAAKGKLTAEDRARIELMLDEKEASDLRILLQKSELKTAEQVSAERQRLWKSDYEAVQKAAEAERETDNARSKSMRDTLAGMADETAALTMTNGQREIAIKLREIEKTGIDKNSVAYLEYAENIRAAVLKKETIDDATKQQVGMWQSIDGAARDTFVSIFDSGKSAFDRLRDTLKNGLFALLYEITVKKWLISISAGVSGAGVAQQAFGATPGSGSGMLNGLSSLTGGANPFTNFGDASLNLLNTAGGKLFDSGLERIGGTLIDASSNLRSFSSTISGVGDALGYAGALYSLSQGNIGSAAGAAIGTYFGGPIGSAIGSALGGLLDGKGDSRQGSQYAYTAGGDTRIVGGPNKGMDFGGQSAAQDAVIDGINSLLKKVGSSQQLANFSSGFESSEKGKGFSYAGGMYSDGKQFGQGIDGLGYQNNRGSKTPDAAIAEYKDELLQATLQALQAAGDIPRSIATSLANVDIDALSEDALNQLIGVIDRQITDIDSLRAAVQTLPFKYLKDISFDAAAGLIAAADGMDAVAGNGLTSLGGLVDNYLNLFTSAEEKTARLTAGTAASFAAFGVTMPAVSESTRDWYKAQVELLGGMDMSVQANAAAYVSVLGLASAIDTLTPAGEQAVSAVEKISDVMKSMTSDIEQLKVDLIRAQGNTAGADAAQYTLDTSALTPAERATYDVKAGYIAQIAALNAATTAAADAAAAALAREKEEAAERAGLQDQLNGLTDTATQALTRQRDALFGSNQALFDNVQAAQAKKAADAEALAAQQAETQRLASVATQRGQLEIQAMQLQGDAAGALAAQRLIEANAMDAALWPLQGFIWGLQDFAAAAQAAGAAYFAQIDRTANVASMVDQGQSALDKLYGTTTTAAGAAAVSAANESLSAAKTAGQAWRSAGDSIRSTLESIRNQTVQLGDNAYDNLWAQFKTVNLLARNDPASAGKLGGVATAFLTASEENSATLQDYLRDRGRVENALSETLQSVDASTSVQDMIANSSAAAVTQLTAMNTNLTGYAAQVYELLSKGYAGADRATAAGASAQYAAAKGEFDNYFATTAAGATQSYAGGTLTRLGGDLTQFTGADGRVDYVRAGESLLDVGKRIAALRGNWEAQYGIDLPAFAGGGSHAGGLRLVGERGWEVEATGPSRIWNQNQMADALRGGGSGGSNDDVVAELRETRAVLKDVLLELEEIKGSNRLMASIEDKWDGDGMPPVRKEMAVV